MPGIWKRILLISTDDKAANELAAWRPRLHIVHWDIGAEYNQKLKFGDIQYFRLMNKRMLLFINLLSEGVNILNAEADALWTSDPLQSLPSLYSGDYYRPWDIAAAWDFSIYMIGFAFIRATEASIEAFSHVFAFFNSLLQRFEDEETLTFWNGKHEGFVFRDYVRLHQHEIRVVMLDPDLHVGGMWYSDVSSVPSCTIPVTIQNNWIAGNEAKIFRSKQFGHWFLGENEAVCVGHEPAQIIKNVVQKLTCRHSPFVGLCGRGCIGTLKDGCMWTKELSNTSIMYSVIAGVDLLALQDLSFEIGLAARYGLTVHLIDPGCIIQESFWGVCELLLGKETNRTMSFNDSQLTEYQWMVRASKVQPQQLQYHSNCPGSSSDIFSGWESCSRSGFNLNAVTVGTNQALCNKTKFSSQHKLSFNDIMIEIRHDHVDLVKLDTNTTSSLGIDMSTVDADFLIIKNFSKDAQLSHLLGADQYRIIAPNFNNEYLTLEKRPRQVDSFMTHSLHSFKQ